MKLDHITFAAKDLEQGRQFALESFGIEVPTGGVHPLMGTHNLLTRIDDGCFLEIIACHPELPAKRRRWFGLDDPEMQQRIAKKPALIGWVMGVQDIDAELGRFPFDLGPAIEVTRGELKWKISVPDDGNLCLAGVAPTMIQWPAGAHPSEKMTDVGIKLESLELFSEHAFALRTAMDALFADQDGKVSIQRTQQDYLTVALKTPKGLVKISSLGVQP
jgi:catechol 2,3-dioxygenase-like lactoylglutathione lyase family enzyme